MQEEVTRKTIALAIKTAKLDGKVLQAALRKLLQLYTDIDIEAVSQEVAYRLMMSHDRLYALALYEWTEQHFTQNSDTSDAAAGENGCDFPTHNNST